MGAACTSPQALPQTSPRVVALQAVEYELTRKLDQVTARISEQTELAKKLVERIRINVDRKLLLPAAVVSKAAEAVENYTKGLEETKSKLETAIADVRKEITERKDKDKAKLADPVKAQQLFDKDPMSYLHKAIEKHVAPLDLEQHTSNPTTELLTQLEYYAVMDDKTLRTKLRELKNVGTIPEPSPEKPKSPGFDPRLCAMRTASRFLAEKAVWAREQLDQLKREMEVCRQSAAELVKDRKFALAYANLRSVAAYQAKIVAVEKIQATLENEENDLLGEARKLESIPTSPEEMRKLLATPPEDTIGSAISFQAKRVEAISMLARVTAADVLGRIGTHVRETPSDLVRAINATKLLDSEVRLEEEPVATQPPGAPPLMPMPRPTRESQPAIPPPPQEISRPKPPEKEKERESVKFRPTEPRREDSHPALDQSQISMFNVPTNKEITGDAELDRDNAIFAKFF